MEKQNDNDIIEIDLLELAYELLSKWGIIVISVVLAAVIAFGYTKIRLTPQYESTSEIYVLNKSTSITSLADIQIGTNLMKDYVVVITDRPVLDQVIENLGLNLNYIKLLQKVAVDVPENSRIIKITVTDTDPDVAKTITDEIAEVSTAFIAEKMSQESPSILSYGYADNAPVSPNIIKNTLLGAVLGAFLSAAAIVIIYLLNDTIRVPEDVEKKLGLTLLATLPLEKEYEQFEETSNRKLKFK